MDEEIEARRAAFRWVDEARLSMPSRFGPWTHDPDLRVLRLDGDRYEVDLDWCATSAEVLDWICQVAGKPWADDVVLAGLVRALDAVLRPQATLCSFGVEVGPHSPGR